MVGVTIMDPFTGTLPIPWLIDALAAPVEVQVNVEELPLLIVDGEAEMLTVGLAAMSSIGIMEKAKKITSDKNTRFFIIDSF